MNKNPSNIINTKNIPNNEDESPSRNINSQKEQQSYNGSSNNNNQVPQYIKQFRETTSVDKSNNNKIKFSSPNDINNRNKIKGSNNPKGRVKYYPVGNIGNIFQPDKNNKKLEKEKSDSNLQKDTSQETSVPYSSINSNHSNKLSEYNAYIKKNYSNNNYINNENYYSANNNISNSPSANPNNYYLKKEALLKKQQQQQRNFLNKKEKEIENYSHSNSNSNSNNNIYKSKTSSEKNKIGSSSDENIIIFNDKENIKDESNKVYISSKRDSNKSTKNLKEFTLEKMPTQKLNNSFTLEQNKEQVKMYIESNSILNEKPSSEVISENLKLEKMREETIKKIKKNENEMKSISYGVYQHVINIYKTIDSNNKDITDLTDSLQKYMKQNLIVKDDKESEELYKNFKKSFFNYIVYEIELKNVESQIEKRKMVGKWHIEDGGVPDDCDNE